MTGAAKKQSFSVTELEGAWGLMQGATPVRTPAGNVLRVPTRDLAEALAGEMTQLRTKKLSLLALALTAQDRIEKAHAQVCESLLDFARTDTLCYRDEKPELAQRQKQLWDPLLSWGEQRFGARLKATDSVLAIEQEEAAITALGKSLNELSSYELAGLGILTQIYASLMLALAVKEGVTDARQAYSLSRLESEFQVERWGEDEEAKLAAQTALEDALLAQQFLRLAHAQSTPRTH